MTKALHPDPWAHLIPSIRSHRAPGARFFKPVCVIWAIDLADEGLFDPEAIDADAVIHRFRRNVGVVHPARADQGWRPLWHLQWRAVPDSRQAIECYGDFRLNAEPEFLGVCLAPVERVKSGPPPSRPPAHPTLQFRGEHGQADV